MSVMDESMVGALSAGFAGQRMLVLPRPLVDRALAEPVTRRLLVTDAGFFPHAVRHGRRRDHGAGQDLVLVCTDGAGWCLTEEGRFDIGVGDILVLPRARAHAYGADEKDPWTLWWFHVRGSDAADLVEAARRSAVGPVAHVPDPAPVASLVSQVIDALDDGMSTSGLVAAAGAAWHALTWVATRSRTRTEAEVHPVDRVLRHLHDTTPQRTDVAVLAAMVGLSSSHLNALFRQQTGTGPLDYQIRLRMARARELLDTTDLSVGAVARATGYSDQLYFSRKFSQVHGQSPVMYRSRHKP